IPLGKSGVDSLAVRAIFPANGCSGFGRTSSAAVSVNTALTADISTANILFVFIVRFLRSQSHRLPNIVRCSSHCKATPPVSVKRIIERERRGDNFHGPFYGRRKFGCKATQFYATHCESEMTNYLASATICKAVKSCVIR